MNELGSDQVAVIPEDSYYNDQLDIPLTERSKTNYDHPDAFEHSLLAQHLEDLIDGKTVYVPTYDFNNHCRSAETTKIQTPRIIVLEGILLFTAEKLRELMDIRIFMDTPLDICLIRRMTRDIVDRGRSLHSVINQYQQTVRPMYYQFIEPCKRYADIIVPRGGENRIAIDMIKAKMRELLI
jgi:uridine kinase